MAGPIADFVVTLNLDGYIISQGSVTEAMTKDPKLMEEMKHEGEAIELYEIEEAATTKPVDETKGKLVVAEEIAIGRVSWDACK